MRWLTWTGFQELPCLLGSSGRLPEEGVPRRHATIILRQRLVQGALTESFFSLPDTGGNKSRTQSIL